jgi:hypothetical protein
MKSIRILFHHDRGLFAWLIRWWTGSRFAHVEVAFDGDLRLKVVAPVVTMEYHGMKPTAVAEVKLTIAQYTAAFQTAQHMVGHRFDVQGIAGQAIGRTTENPDRWFCSEAAARILIDAGCLPADKPAEWYSPERLAQAMGV